MTVGERIRTARLKSGMTQTELAKRLGVSYVNISQWERVDRSPKLETLQKIAAALNVPIEELLGLSENDKITISDEDLQRFSDLLSEGLESVALLAKDERKPFYDLIEYVSTMLKYCRCVGKDIDFVGQTTAVKRFVNASVNLNIVNATLIKQSIEKHQVLNPDKKIQRKIIISTTPPDKDT